MTEICPHEQCTGCTACASACPKHAISMQRDEWGFLYPQVDGDSCLHCGLCQKVCPAQNKPGQRNILEEERFRIAWHREEEVRAKSSSGGAFSALASAVLRRGGHVCGAAFREDYHAVHHLIIHREEELPQLRSSKYIQSDMGQTYAEVKALLTEGEEVLFAGTPCQVAGLRLFLRKEYPNLITLDIVCHGVPSPRIYHDYASWLEASQGGQLTGYTFRDKRWSWTRFNMRADFSNGSAYFGKWETDLFYRGFIQDLYLRDCCYECPFSRHERYSDITLSDFWGVFQEPRKEWADEKGISMCMTHTEKGEQLVHEAAEDMEYHDVEKELALLNGGFRAHTLTRREKEVFLPIYREKGFAAAMELHRISVPIKLRQRILYCFGREHFLTRLMNVLGALSRYRRCRRSQRKRQRQNR